MLSIDLKYLILYYVILYHFNCHIFMYILDIDLKYLILYYVILITISFQLSYFHVHLSTGGLRRYIKL